MEEKATHVEGLASQLLNDIYNADLDVSEVLQKMKLISVSHVNDALMKAQDEVDRLRSLKMKLDKI